jgi:hypothetical protein
MNLRNSSTSPLTYLFSEKQIDLRFIFTLLHVSFIIPFN